MILEMLAGLVFLCGVLVVWNIFWTASKIKKG